MARNTIVMDIRIDGGKELERRLEVARQATGVSGVKIGFFESARYSDGTPVAAVAAWNEWGTSTAPERPFFRASIKRMERELLQTIHDGIDPETLRVDDDLADRLGAQGAGIVQRTIATSSFEPNPPNAPATIKRKGSSRTLIDTGRMRQSVSWRVIK